MDRFPKGVVLARVATPPRRALWIWLGMVPLAIAAICALKVVA